MLIVQVLFAVIAVVSVIFLIWGAHQLQRNLELTKEIDKTKKRLGELDSMKSDFISLATHQIRTPLTAIKGYASLILEEDFGKVPDKLKEPVETILASSNNLVKIVHEFLDISQIEQGRMKYEYSDFDIEKQLEEIVKEFKPTLDSKGLSFHTKEEKGEDYTVRADESKVRNIVMNVIDNAIKYTPKGHIYLRLSRQSDKILIEISDTGIGIPREELQKIFKKFVRASDASEVNVTGTGLGMYIAKEMVEEMGGKIWAESEGEGKGSSWFIELEARNKK